MGGDQVASGEWSQAQKEETMNEEEVKLETLCEQYQCLAEEISKLLEHYRDNKSYKGEALSFQKVYDRISALLDISGKIQDLTIHTNVELYRQAVRIHHRNKNILDLGFSLE